VALEEVDIIWNISLVCPWDCSFCCTDAVHVKQIRGEISMREFGLNHHRSLLIDEIDDDEPTLKRLKALGVKPNAFDLALYDRQKRGLELTYEQKIQVLKNLSPRSAEIDFAGGDPLACYENFLVIQEAKKQFGRDNISITSTGATLSRYSLTEIASAIGEFEFTFDEPIGKKPVNRPLGYNNANLHVAKQLSGLNLKTKAQMPLHSGNLDPSRISLLYNALHEAEVDELLLMRVFPVGRGAQNYSNDMQRSDYLDAINHFRNMEKQLIYPKVRLQCALKHLEKINHAENPCDLMRHSFGINPRGNLLISAWATNPRGEPLDDAFILGDISGTSFETLIRSEKAQNYFKKLDLNWGHCKIFSFVFSDSKTASSLFEKGDPLYA
jgi:MoaA/NifB/PqqE/SkfB family radical SAM enzyme